MGELPSTATDDESLAIRMMDGDEEALRHILREHLEPVRDVLAAIYGATLQLPEIDEAVNTAALKLRESAGQYNAALGTLDAWFFTLAQNAAIDIYRRERRYRGRNRRYGPADDPPVDRRPDDDDQPISKDQEQRLKELDYIIEHKLKGLQQAIIKADLAAGGLADAGRLAEIHSTTKNSIYVSRKKARENIRKEFMQRESRRDNLRGKK